MCFFFHVNLGLLHYLANFETFINWGTFSQVISFLAFKSLINLNYFTLTVAVKGRDSNLKLIKL